MDIDALLEPGRVMESLMRRAARGHKPAKRLLLEITPALCDAEDRLLYPELLKLRFPGVDAAWQLPFDCEHEQIAQLIDQLRATSAARDDGLFRALQWLVIQHLREEREWLREALSQDPPPDPARLERYLEQTRPLVQRGRALLDGQPADRNAAARGEDEAGGGVKVMGWPCGA
jgi:hypothetical protein